MREGRVATLLDLHQARREQGLRAVSVLVGVPAMALAHWRNWAVRQGRAVLRSETASPREWVAGWLARDDAAQALLDGLGASLGQQTARLDRQLAAKTDHDLAVLVGTLAPEHCDDPSAAALLRWLRARCTRTGQPHALLPESVDPESLLLTAAHWCPDSELPALVGTGGRDVTALTASIECCHRLVGQRPAWPVALLLDSAAYQRFVADLAPSRAKALLQEGLIALSADTGMIEVPTATERYLRQLGARSDTLALLTEAARRVDEARSRPDTVTDDAARSSAERFLFACLELCPHTAGLFRLNVELEVRFGNRPLEVDLLMSRCRLAVEVDGYYHFRDRDNYRRDRRKDLILQTQGYMVLRFLAEDVVGRLETVLDTIRRTVAARRNGSC